MSKLLTLHQALAARIVCHIGACMRLVIKALPWLAGVHSW